MNDVSLVLIHTVRVETMLGEGKNGFVVLSAVTMHVFLPVTSMVIFVNLFEGLSASVGASNSNDFEVYITPNGHDNDGNDDCFYRLNSTKNN